MHGGAVMDIVVWLRSLGLGKYEAIFRDNDIDETVLPSLTHENLRELGVASFGHRVKLLDAIAALRADAARAPLLATEPARPSGEAPIALPIAETAGERRHVTVMFCDLVGSTSISAGLDAEDWRNGSMVLRLRQFRSGDHRQFRSGGQQDAQLHGERRHDGWPR
jgi:SAM domain (Sterile alpha motif)